MVDITSQVDTSGLAELTQADANDVKTPIDDLIGVINNVLNGVQVFDALNVNGNVTQTPGSSIFYDVTSAVGGALSLRGTKVSSINTFDSFEWVSRRARSGPSAVLANDRLGGSQFHGYDGSVYAAGGNVKVKASENWSGSARGAEVTWEIVPNGGTVVTPVLVMTGSAVNIKKDLDHDGTNVGFYNTTPAAKQTVTGSRGGNAALASLLTALATIGLVTDSSSA